MLPQRAPPSEELIRYHPQSPRLPPRHRLAALERRARAAGIIPCAGRDPRPSERGASPADGRGG
jgi:hypothetical protein